MRSIALHVGLALTLAAGAAGQSVARGPADSGGSGASAVWNGDGITVRFPRAYSPDSVTVEGRVGDAFSGYEWRVILVGDTRAFLAAFVITPTDSLTIHRYRTIAEAFRAGNLRRCSRNDQVLVCARPARGLVRDADGRLEIGIGDREWINAALAASQPKVRLIVKRAQETLWSEEIPISYDGGTP